MHTCTMCSYARTIYTCIDASNRKREARMRASLRPLYPRQAHKKKSNEEHLMGHVYIYICVCVCVCVCVYVCVSHRRARHSGVNASRVAPPVIAALVSKPARHDSRFVQFLPQDMMYA